MSRLNIESYCTDKLTIALLADGDDGDVVIKFKGMVEPANTADFLNPFLDTVHQRVVELGLPHVTVDFTELTFLNSSGIKMILRWIMKQELLQASRRYLIKIRYSRKITWQQSSLYAITFVAKGLVEATSV